MVCKGDAALSASPALEGSDAFFCLRYSHNRSAITEPPGRTSIAAYGASSRSLSTTAAARAPHLRCGFPHDVPPLPVDSGPALKVAVDSLANIIINLSKPSLPNLKTNEEPKTDIGSLNIRNFM
jgi:hypothetical protein